MFDYSIAVLQKTIRNIKKGMFVLSIVAQLFFIGFYVYLSVIHFDELILFVSYATATSLAFIILILRCALDPYDKVSKRRIKNFKFVLRILSWFTKGVVIGYNIYYLIQHPISDMNKIFLIISIIVLVVDIACTLIGRFITRSSEHLIYALKKDYENFYRHDDDIDPSTKPIGQAIEELNSGKNYEKYTDMVFIEQRLFDAIHQYINQHFIETGKVIKRRKLEKLIFSRYEDADYLLDNKEKIKSLFLGIYNTLKSDAPKHIKVLLFFAINEIENIYPCLSRPATKLVLTALTFYKDEGFSWVSEIFYRAVVKDVITLEEDLKHKQEERFSKKGIFRHEENNSSFYTDLLIKEVLEIIKEDKKEFKVLSSESFSGEIKSMIGSQVSVGDIMEAGKKKFFKWIKKKKK